ncbi:MAG TPA: M3 family metallopeptidase [Candidatus Angelobacter sp.]|nr:M3 family metallopeptidase [Candidatus Angelobacter sp.]
MDFLSLFARLDGAPLNVGIELLAIVDATDRAYARALEWICNQFELTEFRHSDVIFVQHQCKLRAEREFGAGFTLAQSLAALKSTLIYLGLEGDAHSIRALEGKYFTPEDQKSVFERHRQIIIRNRREQSEKQFGECHDFDLTGAFVDVNLFEDGIEAYRILFHEVGHALHFTNIRAKYATLRLDMPRFFTEGVAQVFQSLTIEPQWLQTHVGLTVDQAKCLRMLLDVTDIITLRANIAFALFETFAHICQDEWKSQWEGKWRELWLSLSSRILLPGTSDVHATGYADYMDRMMFHNFSATDVAYAIWIREQIRMFIKDKCGALYTNCGELLRSIYRPGGSCSWDNALSEVGIKLSTAGLRQYFEETFLTTDIGMCSWK